MEISPRDFTRETRAGFKIDFDPSFKVTPSGINANYDLVWDYINSKDTVNNYACSDKLP